MLVSVLLLLQAASFEHIKLAAFLPPPELQHPAT
jgi:hypothetical protein